MSLDFQDRILRNSKIYLIPGKFQSAGKYYDIYEKTYIHWRQMWEDILDSGKNTNSDNFIRQDILCPIVFRSDVIGLIGCNFFALNQKVSLDHSFTKSFPKETFKNISESSSFMSIEYLSVHPEFRKSIIGYSLGDVLIGLSMEIFKKSNAIFVLGTARKKNNVNKMCNQFGFKEIGNIERFGLNCSQILNSQESVKEHPDKFVKNIIDDLWKTKESAIEITNFDYRNNSRRAA